MTSTFTDFDPLVIDVLVGAVHVFERTQDVVFVGIESSLQVADEGVTISPLLDSHQTVRVMIPSKEAQSVLSHELQGLVDQKYEGQIGGFDRSKEISTLISSSTSPRVLISVSSIMIEAFEPRDE
jgi:hypothetical protein